MEPIANQQKEVINTGKAKKSRKAQILKFDPFDPEFHADPYPTYHRLRAEEPVLYQSFMDVWILTRYADVKEVLQSSIFSVDQVPKRIKDKNHYLQEKHQNLNTLARASSNFLFYLDPPEHTRLRKLVSKAFSPKLVEGMYPKIQEIVDDLLDQVEDNGSMDIIADFACPLPVRVISRMLGVPSENSRQLHQWSSDLSRILDPLLSLADYEYMNQVAEQFIAYFSNLVAERKKNPQSDLISDLIAARDDGKQVTEDEIVFICMLLFMTGEETTVNTIGNGMLALLRHPEQMEKVKREPTTIQSAVAEILRYDSPVQMTVRRATEEVEISGQTIGRGSRVLLCLGAANRDPAQFSDPDRLCLTRSENYHLAFSDGIHYCLGAALAQVQSEIAIDRLIQRLPDLNLVSEKLQWRKHIFLRGLKALPVTFRI